MSSTTKLDPRTGQELLLIVIAKEYFRDNAELLVSANSIKNAIDSGEVAQIEAATSIKAMIDAGTSKLDNELGRMDLHLPQGYRGRIYEGIVIRTFCVKKATPGQYAACLLSSMQAMHDVWVRDHGEQFFENEAGQWRFLPFELLGWYRAERYLNYLKPFLDDIQLEIDRAQIRSEYDRMVARFKNQHSIVGQQDVEWKLREGSRFYQYLTDEVSMRLRRERRPSFMMSKAAVLA